MSFNHSALNIFIKMAFRPSELNLFFKYNLRLKLLRADIKFLIKCKKSKVVPKFISNFKNKTINERVKKAYDNAKTKWLILEIKFLHSKLSKLELELYQLHIKLSNSMSKLEWDTFLEQVNVVNLNKYDSKLRRLRKKFKNLKPVETIDTSNNPSINNFVKNESSISFNPEEISLLSNGLKHSIPTKSKLINIISDIETGIKYLNDQDKNYIRNACKLQITDNLSKISQHKNINKDLNILKNLKNKDCFYLKADKGNTVVILDKQDYFDRGNKLLQEGPYINIPKNPLSKFVSNVKNCLKQCPTIIPKNDVSKFMPSNPGLPKMYCLPKIHKPGKSMRPIVNNIDSPSYNLSKWLTIEFSNMQQIHDQFSIKNSLELVSKIKDLKLKSTEILVSFDVCALFPSIPIDVTLKHLKNFLLLNNIDLDRINEYIKLTETCMNNNFFQFNGNFYKQHSGTTMGNCLSPFIANLFMSNLESEIKKDLKYFPRVWFRYVDDIFAIFDNNKYDINKFIDDLNSRFPSIKFTHEIESNNKIPFLDLMIHRKNDTIEFDIYRKPTNNNRYIMSHSNHPLVHKQATFQSMIHRLLTIPLNKQRFENELLNITNIAKLNGYSPDMVMNILKKKKVKLNRTNITTLVSDKPPLKYIGITYDPILTKGLDSIFKKVNLIKAFKNDNSISKFLGNPKDSTPILEKSGIYQINCDTCDKLYIGQTRRQIMTRWKEHFSHIKFCRPEKSSVADHILETNHNISIKNLSLLKTVNNKHYLDSLESIYIAKHDKHKLLNSDNGPIPYSALFDLLKP